MNKLSVVIPSKTMVNFLASWAAVHLFEQMGNVLLVDDGMEVTGRFPVDRIPGVQPFCFARNVNLGIEARGADDIIVLNDDAILHTPDGFTAMQRAAEEHPEFGIISATTNVTGNPEQKPQGIGLRAAKGSVAFIAVLIPRQTIDRVGLMDERFGGLTPQGKRIYGYCDNDYCRRVRDVGLQVGVFDGCFVDHASLRSSFRGDPHAAGDIAEGRKLYVEKWGDAR
jgi:GT2 family glycosyltransferase